MPNTENVYLNNVPIDNFPSEIVDSAETRHDSGTDQYLDKGGENEVSAEHIKEVVDAYQVASSPFDPYGVVDPTVTDTKLAAWQQLLGAAGKVMQDNLNINSGELTTTSNQQLRTNGVYGGSGAFTGNCLRPDGSIVFAPHSSNAVGILTSDGLFRRDILHGQGATAYYNCCYWNENNVTIFNPSTTQFIARLNVDDTFETILNHGMGAGAFQGCTPRYDGKVIFTPHVSPAVGILNEDYTFSVVEPHNCGSGAFMGKPVQRADGSMVFAPNTSNKIGILYPDNTFEGIDYPLNHTYRYQSAVLRPDNVVVFIPRRTSHFMLLYPDNRVEMIYNKCYYHASYDTFYGGTLLPNGDVLCCPYYQANFGVVHADNTYSQFPSGMGSYHHFGVCTNVNGNAVTAPHNGSYGQILDIDYRYNFDKEFLTRR